MKEVPFIPEHEAALTGLDRTKQVMDRLSALAFLARRLVQSGWSMQFTVGGLAFAPPENPSEGETHVEIDQWLSELGLEDEVNETPSRALVEIVETEDQCKDRCRYEKLDRDLRSDKPMCECCEENQDEAMTELEKRYGRRSLVMPSDYERGVLHGKYEALRWVLGDDWQDPRTRRQEDRLEKLAETAVAVADVQEFLADTEDDEDVDEQN